MKKKTRKDYELYLNELGCSYENCEYLTNKNRNGGYLKPQSLKTSLSEGKYGTVLRKYDPIAFNVGFNEWEQN